MATVTDWGAELDAELGASPQTDWGAELDAELGQQQPEQPPEKMGWLEWAGRGALRTGRDVGVTALKGAVGLPQSVTGMADMIPVTAAIPGGGPGGPVAKVAERMGVPLYGWSGWMQKKLGVRYDDAQQTLHEAFSPETQQAYRNVSEAKGVLGKVGAALTNPSVVFASVGESIPSMLAGGAIGKAASGIPVIGKYGYAIGEGMISAGAGAEQTRGTSESGFLSEEQVATHAASGVLTGMIGVLGGKVASRLGVDDIDVLLAGGASQEAQRNVVIRALAGALIEGGVEEAPQSVQEQIASNLAQGKPWHEGWDESLVVGALSGAVMGGGIQLRPRLDNLRQIRSKGFVSEEDAKKAGLSGATRKERMAALNEEVTSLEQEIQDAEETPPPTEAPVEAGEVVTPPVAEVAPAPEATVEEEEAAMRAALDEEFAPKKPVAAPETPVKETQADIKKRLDEARARGDVTMREVDKGTDAYRGKGGIASEAQGSGFQAAFRDNDTGEIAVPKTDLGTKGKVPSGVHLFDGLPDSFVTERNKYGDPIAVK
ncbi:MAG: hypothetical protein ABIJ86_07835, partial [Spirochaetota bacterium]